MIQTLFGSLNPPPEPESVLQRMKQAMARTRAGLGERVEELLAYSRPVDEQALASLEDSLIGADLGVATVARIMDDLRQKLRRTELQDGDTLRNALQQHIEQILNGVNNVPRKPSQPPAVIFLVGVNGTGKTTTAGKLSAYLQGRGQRVLLCAADTFRAAAIEQLETWSQRSGVELVKSRSGADPSAVLFDALQAARARGADSVIVDTAGRLHTKGGLMAELEKMHRTARRFSADAPHETLLVLDAVTGQNGLQQARVFTESAGVTGIVLTKLDGTAKGGIVVAIAQELRLPVRFVGVGEKLDDLLEFDPHAFTESLLSSAPRINRVTQAGDTVFMERALALANEGASVASPNPTVGCVVVKNGAIVGEGYHDYQARDHAEIVALRHAGDAARGATVYVTLEPCSTSGRTGPCADALAVAGVARVVAATQDPNPAVAGRGLQKLRDAGIAVEAGCMQAQARRLNDAFAKFITTREPYVLLKYAMSLDGRIAPPRGTLPPGERFRVTGREAHARVHSMRNRSDAILTGIGTVLADNALLTDRSGLPRRRPLLRVVLDSHLRLPLDSRLVQSAKTGGDVLVCYHHADEERLARLRDAGIELLQIGSRGGLVSAAAVLRALGEREITSVLVEPSAQLGTHMLAARIADALALFVAPIVLGANAVPLFISRLPHPLRLQNVTSEQVGADTLLSGYLRDPWAAVP